MPESSTKDRLRDLERQLQQREYEIALLREVTQVIGSDLDLDSVFNAIAQRARELIQAETVLVPILNRECDEYTYRAGAGEHIKEIVGESLPLDFGVCGWVWRHRRPWWRGVLNDLSPDEKNQWESEAGTLLLVPLVGRRHFLGGLAGINKLGGGDFTEGDLHLLELFAGQAAIAIENAMAMEKAEQARRAAESYQMELQQVNKRLTAVNAELEYVSLYDPLTGLPNRTLFRDRVRHELDVATRGLSHISILVVDLDQFQEINDSLGHDVGDELLKIVAQRFVDTLGPEHTISRISGDEFSVLLSRADRAGAVEGARALAECLKTPVQLAGQDVLVSAGIGIACHPQHGEDFSTLMKHADLAMSVAKRDKSVIHVFDEQRDESSPGRLALIRDLRGALDAQEFALYYQPKVALGTGLVVGVEALARWPSKTRGFVPTEMFITALEQTGLIQPFTFWALETAVGQRIAWLERGWDIRVAVNVPLSVVMSPRFVAELSALIARHRLAHGLVLEITENIFLGDYDRLNTILATIQTFGVEFSIDDFGTGHSSLSRLRKLPVAEIKIDRSFVLDMLRSKDDAVIVKSTIDLAHNLGLKVVAEGVESAAHLQELYRLRCDLVQGYHISRPLPCGEFEAFLAESRWLVAPISDRLDLGADDV